jgi:hypothetical protein
MIEPAVSDEELTVDVVWTAPAAGAYARVLQAAQEAVVGQGERKWTAAAGAVVAVAAGIAAFAATASPLWATLATFTGLAAVVAGQWSYYLDMRSKDLAERLFAGDPSAYPPRSVILHQTHLSEISSGMSWQIALSRIERVSRAEGLLMIWISRADAMAIPEHCFATPKAAEIFTETLNARIKAALNTTG